MQLCFFVVDVTNNKLPPDDDSLRGTRQQANYFIIILNFVVMFNIFRHPNEISFHDVQNYINIALKKKQNYYYTIFILQDFIKKTTKILEKHRSFK